MLDITCDEIAFMTYTTNTFIGSVEDAVNQFTRLPTDSQNFPIIHTLFTVVTSVQTKRISPQSLM